MICKHAFVSVSLSVMYKVVVVCVCVRACVCIQCLITSADFRCCVILAKQLQLFDEIQLCEIRIESQHRPLRNDRGGIRTKRVTFFWLSAYPMKTPKQTINCSFYTVLCVYQSQVDQPHRALLSINY